LHIIDVQWCHVTRIYYYVNIANKLLKHEQFLTRYGIFMYIIYNVSTQKMITKSKSRGKDLQV